MGTPKTSMPGKQKKETKHRSSTVKNLEGHKAVLGELTGPPNYKGQQPRQMQADYFRWLRKTWQHGQYRSLGRWQCHVSSRFYLDWTLAGNQVERRSPASPGKGLTKPRLDVRGPAKQESLSGFPEHTPASPTLWCKKGRLESNEPPWDSRALPRGT